MSTYKRLRKEDVIKLNHYRKIKGKMKKNVNKIVILFLIFFLLVFSFILFYRMMYGKNFSVNNVKHMKSDSDFNNGVTAVVTDSSSVSSTNELNVLDSSKKQNESEKKEINSQEIKLYDFGNWNKKCSKELLVINKDNEIPKGVKVSTKSCHGKEIAVEVCDSLNSMISDAKKDGITLWISSGYRNIELQTKLFNRRVEKEKERANITDQEAKVRAAKVVAKPGTSEHNTGLAVDFNGVKDDFYKTNEYKWLINNAHKYGFIERYTKSCQNKTGVIAEPWHFRYVGKEYAAKIKGSGLCLEDYVQKYLEK